METLQSGINREVMAGATTLFTPYRDRAITDSLWISLLRLLFGLVEPSSVKAAELARQFYDEERARHFPNAPRHDIYLQTPTFERFVDDMEVVRLRMSRGSSTDQDVRIAAMRAVRTVENSGRWTLMKAVEEEDPYLDSKEGFTSEFSDPRPREKGTGYVRGWARVATGRETCGWCLMLVSRGPVYASPKSAGSRLDTRDALQTTGSNTFDTKEHMHAWHTGCDCKIVPVFKLNDWEGRERHKAAERMWRDVTKGYSGKDAVNAFRRAAEKGEYTEYLSKF